MLKKKYGKQAFYILLNIIYLALFFLLSLQRLLG